MSTTLRRDLGLLGAVLTGLGSIVGTGVFVAIGVAAGVAGPAVLLATVLAAGVATCNALSSAQLAAAHPVSGGTYEYGYRLLTPEAGFAAGWMFLWAKSASAATAALGLAGYLLHLLGATGSIPLRWIALPAVGLLTVVVAGGIRRSHRTNLVVVGVAVGSLVLFVAAGLGGVIADGGARLRPFFDPAPGGGIWPSLLEATALMFVAYTGYGRIATLGEEVRSPARTIPRAIVVTLLVTGTLYTAVALVAVGRLDARDLAAATEGEAAPLEVVARGFQADWVAPIVAMGAVTAMLGVLLNLLLGLSRVAMAMGRRGDLPRSLAKVDMARSSPVLAVLTVGAVVALLVAIGTVTTTWSFSAFTVLVYYGLTNLAALRLPPEARRFPRWVAALGLVACAGLAFWVEPAAWGAGILVLAAGLVWHRSRG